MTAKVKIHSSGREYQIGMRAAYAHLRNEKAIKEAVARVLEGYRKQGPAWSAYADAMEKRSLMEQLRLIGMISN